MARLPSLLPIFVAHFFGDDEMEMKKSDNQREVDDNYEEFKKMLPSIIGQHRDKFALMKDKKVLGYFSTAQDAREAANSFVKYGVYSIQHVTDVSINFHHLYLDAPG